MRNSSLLELQKLQMMPDLNLLKSSSAWFGQPHLHLVPWGGLWRVRMEEGDRRLSVKMELEVKHQGEDEGSD